MTATNAERLQAELRAESGAGARGFATLFGWFLFGAGVVFIGWALSTNTAVDAVPSLASISSRVAAGIPGEVPLEHVADAGLVGLQLVRAVVGAALLVSGSVWLTRRR